MNIVSVGGGPAGLYFGILMKKAFPDARIQIHERNRADDTFGWGGGFSAETLEKTWFGELARGRSVDRTVNLERSLRLADRLGGHLVSGHVDTVGEIAGIADSNDGGRVFTFDVPPAFERYLVEKGSVCVDGISLTVVSPRERLFDVAIIPETLKRTNLGTAEVGQSVHLEADMIGKWIERLLAARG